jgi:hypothetical protein
MAKSIRAYVPCRQKVYRLVWSRFRCSTRIGSPLFSKTRLGWTNALAYHSLALVTMAKSIRAYVPCRQEVYRLVWSHSGCTTRIGSTLFSKTKLVWTNTLAYHSLALFTMAKSIRAYVPCRQEVYRLVWSHSGCTTRIGSTLLEKTRLGWTNTVAYHSLALVTMVKSFRASAPVDKKFKWLNRALACSNYKDLWLKCPTNPATKAFLNSVISQLRSFFYLASQLTSNLLPS